MPNVIMLAATPQRLSELRQWSQRVPDDDDLWTVPKTARPGDLLVFYIAAPTMAVAAWAVVAGSPSLVPATEYWAGYYMASIKDVRLLSAEVGLYEMRKKVPKLKWLDQPRRFTTIRDDATAATVLRVLGIKP